MIPEHDVLSISEVVLPMRPSVRRDAEQYSEKAGVSLIQFINAAVSEKLAQVQNEEWIRHRQPMTEARRLRALELLGRAGDEEPESWDRLPEGYERS